MKLFILKMLVKQYMSENELARLAKHMTDIVSLKPIDAIEPPTHVGIIITDKEGTETRLELRKPPVNWKESGYKWRLNPKWFERKALEGKNKVQSGLEGVVGDLRSMFWK